MSLGKYGNIRAKMAVFGQSDCIRAKVLVFRKKLFYSGKSGCIQAKVVVFGKSRSNRAKVVVFG